MSALPMELRRRFRSGRPSLNLVHTGGAVELDRAEVVHTPADLGRFLGILLGAPPIPADAHDLAAMRTLRSAVMRMAYGFAVGTRPLPADVDVLNAFAAQPPLVRSLHWEGGTRLVEPTAAAALASLARDAVDLFGGRLAARIRVCAAEDCGLLFVDASRPGRRRWCSMERCGNLAKVRGHRARRAD
ncbi:CGNR zinc finger domain-containing protein [Pseudonocardia humida]|uniref:CGNR zinc finger domain-containing protein n=1 Tax=Pseudonocardia humida TaxID=2800819 RepID=A0ABT1A411_9PSEU|nr:CGNR zinc finger domain-containing protein [Pseudonocardia humida]MCO1657745.1 CGNR zinc finger domain-containing protein [Pseudonocardia humida]